jgi:hypothetical protein
MMKSVISGCLAGSMLFFCGCSFFAEKDPVTEEFLSFLKESDDTAELVRMPMLHWQSKCDYKVVYSDAEKVSYRIEKWSYTGGAHGMTNTKVGTFRNGKQMTLADLPGDVPVLWQKAIVKHFKAESFEKHVKERTVFKPYLTENFYLDDKGIHFIYDPYEIDCFAAGTIDIFVPYKFKMKKEIHQ